ncbi:MAG TPA: hypothetical protein VEA80_12325 [Vitreimonas sp.]|nr:hypothetical protein [Vitreimonas sp.]HYD88257.1 hypothetical protein [Vitreimonas sp.]
MNIDPVIGLCLGIAVFAVVNAWWVLRPFERARRARKNAGHAAE